MPALTGDEPLITSCDQDINLDGYPDLLVREYTGGGHCCTIDHVFSLRPDGIIPYESIDYYTASQK